MASAVDCKAAEQPNGLKKPLAEPSASAAPVAALHPAATTAQEIRRYDEHAEVERRLALDFIFPSLSSQGDGNGYLGGPKSMSQLLSSLENVAPQAGLGSSRLSSWMTKEDGDAVYLKVPMPGVAKEHVQVRVEKNILLINGKGEKGPLDGDDAVPTYNRRIEVPADAYKVDQIKGEMKNGVLWLIVPKVEQEERKDVFEVKIE